MRVLCLSILLVFSSPAFSQEKENLSQEEIDQLFEDITAMDTATDEEKAARLRAVISGESVQDAKPEQIRCSGKLKLNCIDRVMKDESTPAWVTGLIGLLLLSVLIGLVYRTFDFFLGIVLFIKALFANNDPADEGT